MLPIRKAFVLLLVFLNTMLPGQASVMITEFLANNGGELQDEDSESPSWIELHSTGPLTVDLNGWHLTDDPSALTKWTFPTTYLPAGGYLVVFASGKNRANIGSPLHTNFKLDQGGEFLAVVQPNGTVEHTYSPAYPRQRQNVSYGVESQINATSLISTGATARFLVPTDGSLGATWTMAAFNDSGWTQTTTPVSFSTGVLTTPVLAMDVNDRDNLTGVTEAGFSPFVINSNTSSSAIQTLPTVRTMSGITITVSNTPGYGYDDRKRAVPVNNGAFTEALLLQDLLFSQDNTSTGGLNIALAGLIPNQGYRMTIWSFDGSSSGAKVSDWYANGALVMSNYTFDSTILPTSNDQYRFTFDAAATISGEILISGRRSLLTSTFGAYLNALKVEQLSVQAATNALGSQMLSNNATAYIRIPFSVTDANAFQTLRLRMRYDDGFVAYINGQLVASRNASSSPQWNSSATASASDSQSLVYEDIIITNTPGLLATGADVLAIQGLNASAADPDFLILPELEGLAATVIAERYFTPPTPGAANGPGYLGLVADTKFSVDRGFYDAPFNVEIISATTNAAIYWTTNGSIPSPTNGSLYTSPIEVTGITSLRAAAFLTNYVPSIPDAQSYLFLNQVLQQSDVQAGYPAAWQGSYPADYGMDPSVVNSSNYGPTLTNDLRAIPTLSLVSDHDSFWNPTTGIYVDALNDRGERAVSAEMFNGDNTSEFQINAAIQMHGQAGRDNARSPKHSMRLEFKSDYGPSRLDHDVFGGGVTDFNSLILRSSWADEWVTRYDPFSGGSYPWPDDFPLRYRPENATYLRDMWVKQAMTDMGHLATRGRYVHIYINGLYWGIYNLTERVDPAFFANNFGGYEKDWDIMKDFSELQDGTRTDWDNLIALVNQGVNNESDFQAVAALVDIGNLTDYFLLHALVEANDWLQSGNPHNWYGAHRRANLTNGLPATKWIFLPWDQEIAFNRLRNDDRVNGLSNESLPSRIYNQLRNFPEFRRMYGDHVQKQMFNGGALSPTNNILRLQALAQTINQAIVAESARWGDAREFTVGSNPGTGHTFTRDEWWLAELQQLYTNWFPNVMHQRTIARLQAAGLYPTVGAPEFSQFGGAVSNGFSLTITHTNAAGLIYFTVDGTDPRQYGTGAIGASAQAYSTPIPINGPTQVRARVYNGGTWSAIIEATFYPPQDLSKLALTEIMYNPPAMAAVSGNNLEFLELKNTGPNTLDLSGLTFTSGIDFTFTNGTTLAPGTFFVLARDAAAFATKYPGVTVNGTYTGQLDNSGEKITLSHPLGTPVFSVTYYDRPNWPLTPDLADFSLVPVNPDISQAPDNGYRWRASTNPGGSPGVDDPTPVIAPIVISELLTHTDLPEKDSIELYNPTSTNVNIGGWFLTDDLSVPNKFRIPVNTSIPAGGYVYFDEDDFNANPNATNSFRLSSVGDDVHLFSANTNGTFTGYNNSAEFGASFNGVAFGRVTNSVGETFYSRQTSVTLGSANSGPVIGPVVISEINYHPDAAGVEFVELLNVTASPVAFYHPAFPTNTWKLSGAGFIFPTNVTLDANVSLLVVATSPAEFRSKYNVSTNVQIFGPFTGQLQDSGENIELQAPDTPNTNEVPYVTIDAVRYNDREPWPSAADGSGLSLQRVPTTGYGNEPTNWIAAAPTPGEAAGTGDSDNDGMPDAWEQANGTFVFISDANDDLDHDGLSNWEEYLAGTLANDPSSALRLAGIRADASNAILQFMAAPNRTYSVLYMTSLSDAAWSKLTDIPAQPTSHLVNITNGLSPVDTKFYRLATPMQP